MGWYRADVLDARIAFTDRRGGVSGAPYASLSLSTAQGDDPLDVVANRRRALEFLGLGVPGEDWAPPEQVHGTGVLVLGPRPTEPVQADAVVVTRPGAVGGIVVADCAPIAIVGPGAVAAVHAGWHGLLAGVVASAAAVMRGEGAEPAAAVLGPCIRPCCYEFGEQDLDRVALELGPAVRSQTRAGRPALDIPAGVRGALAGAGVERVTEVDVCTSCSPDYFSHRRDGGAGGATGRQALLVTRRGA